MCDKFGVSKHPSRPSHRPHRSQGLVDNALSWNTVVLECPLERLVSRHNLWKSKICMIKPGTRTLNPWRIWKGVWVPRRDGRSLGMETGSRNHWHCLSSVQNKGDVPSWSTWNTLQRANPISNSDTFNCPNVLEALICCFKWTWGRLQRKSKYEHE